MAVVVAFVVEGMCSKIEVTAVAVAVVAVPPTAAVAVAVVAAVTSPPPISVGRRRCPTLGPVRCDTVL